MYYLDGTNATLDGKAFDVDAVDDSVDDGNVESLEDALDETATEAVT